MRILRVLFVCIAAGMVCSKAAYAAVWYVSPSGADTNAGTLTAPFKTFAKGISLISPGDELVIRGGTYTQRLVVAKSGTAAAPLTIRAYTGERPVLDGQNTTANILDLSGSNISVSGVEAKNSSGYGASLTGSAITLSGSIVHDAHDHGIYTDGSDIVITGNTVYRATLVNSARNMPSGWGSGIKVRVGGNRITIEGNTVYHNYGEGIAVTRGTNTRVTGNVVYDNYGANIYIDNSHDITVEKNFCYCTPNSGFEQDGHAARAFTLGSEYYDGWGAQLERITVQNNLSLNCYKGIEYWGSDVTGGGLKNASILHNTFWGNAHTAVSVAYSPYTTESIIAGNIVEQKDQKLAWIENRTGLTLHHNFWVGGMPPASSNAQGTGDRSGDVKLATAPVAPNPQTLKLSPSSPAINGIPQTLGVAGDYYGGLRPVGSGYDMGAHEWQTVVSSPTPSIPIPTYQIHTPTRTRTPTPSPSPTTPAGKPGDANGDNLVDEADYTIWKSRYGQTVSGAANGDFNGDGKTDGKDYVIWMQNYGQAGTTPTRTRTPTRSPTPTPRPNPTGTGHQWNMEGATAPRVYSTTPGVQTIVLPGNYLGTINHNICCPGGPGYIVSLNQNMDYIVTSNQVLHYPVQITGGRHVRVIGLHIDIDVPTCSNNQIPGCMALRVAQYGSTFIEGAYIDNHGRYSDCIVARNPAGSTRGEHDIIVQNSVCRGNGGDSYTHGDFLQTQGQSVGEKYRNIQFVNNSHDSSCEGIVLESVGIGDWLALQSKIWRYDYRRDDRYPVNLTGGAIMHSAQQYSYKDIWISGTSASVYELGMNGGYSSIQTPSTNPNIHSGLPGVRFATSSQSGANSDWVGVNYISPW